MLVVDATQGIEAQTVANAMMAMNANLEIVPLINKIDLPAAEPERVRAEIEDGLAIPADDAVLASGKTGVGVHDLLESIVYNVPHPVGGSRCASFRFNLRLVFRCVSWCCGFGSHHRWLHEEGAKHSYDGY